MNHNWKRTYMKTERTDRHTAKDKRKSVMWNS